MADRDRITITPLALANQFQYRLQNVGVTPLTATVVEANIRDVFAAGTPSMDALEFVQAWMFMKRRRCGFGYVNLTHNKVSGSVDLLIEAIAAGLVRVEGRGHDARFLLMQPEPMYERSTGGARFILPPGPRSTRHERHTALVGPLLVDRLTRMAHHPAKRHPLIPDAWVSANWIRPGGIMVDALPALIRKHESPEWTMAMQTQWLAMVTHKLWRLDYSLPETALPEDDVEALAALA